MTDRSKGIALAALVFALGCALGILGLDWLRTDPARESNTADLTLDEERTSPTQDRFEATPETRLDSSPGTSPNGGREELVPRYRTMDLEVVVQPPVDHEFTAPVRVRIEEVPALTQKPRVRKREAMAPAADPIVTFEGIPPSRYQVFAWSDGFDLAWSQPTFDDTDPSPTFTMSLLPLASLHGRLLTEERNVPPPSHVQVHLHRTEVTIEGYKPRFQTFTDSMGSYRFEKVPRGFYDLFVGPVDNPLVPPLRVHVTQVGSEQDVHKLPRSGEVQIQIRDGDGLPVEGVRVTVAPREGDEPLVDPGIGIDEPLKPRGGGQGTTDADGILRLGGLPVGTYTLVGTKDGYRSLLTRLEIPVDTAPIPVALVLRK